MRKRFFSLIELLVVIFLILLISSVVMVNLQTDSPAAVLDSTAVKLERLFANARMIALTGGKQVEIVYDKKENIIYAPKLATEKNKFLKKRLRLKLKDKIIVEELTGEDKISQKSWQFFSDSTANGPDFYISFKGLRRKIILSYLSGIVKTQKVKNK